MNFRTTILTIFCVLLTILMVACGAEDAPSENHADHVFLNGGVYTVNEDQPWVEAVAVSGNRIIYTGDNDGASKLVGPNTKVTDLTGRMLLPGFGDSHLHLLYGGEIISSCNLDWAETPEEIARILLACDESLADNPGEWIYATLWARWSFPDERPPPEFLNRLFPQRPVSLEASDGHSLFVNQAALNLSGITDETPDPPDGVIERDPATGKANGMLHESAMRLTSEAMGEESFEDRLEYIRNAVKLARSHGITSAIEPGLNLDQARLFASLDDAGELNMRLLLALTPIGFEIAAFDDDIYRTIARRSEAESALIQTNSVKVFADGVIENGTAPLLEPYISESIQPLDPFYPPESLEDYFTRLDRDGINVHVHAIGDRAIRESLDAFESMRESNGMSDQRHVMTHLQLIAEEDIPRFAELNITSSFSTLWAYPEEYNLEIYPALIGQERIMRTYPIASILESGGRVTIGSDWSVTDLNPFLAIEVAMTRQDPYSNSGPALNENERISLETAIEAYTINVAYTMKLENQTGSIETGKLSDLLVLNQNLFEIPVYDIGDTQVVLTMFDGEILYKKDDHSE